MKGQTSEWQIGEGEADGRWKMGKEEEERSGEEGAGPPFYTHRVEPLAMVRWKVRR